MTTQSIYIIGGAGAGKSTFMAQLLDRVAESHGPLIDLHSKRNSKALVTLRGHQLYPYAAGAAPGVYLGHLRDYFPGTDGLDRASSPVGAEWLHTAPLPPFIIAEGATLSTRPFLYALNDTTNLMLVHLYTDPMIVDLRFLQRGSAQDPSWVQNTVTRADNLFRDLVAARANGFGIDTSDAQQWAQALERCAAHVGSA